MSINYAQKITTHTNLCIAVDFDGTIVDHQTQQKDGEWTTELVANYLAIDTLKDLVKKGHKLILWTCRTGATLRQAVQYLDAHDVQLTGVNENPVIDMASYSPKVFCNIYIDDAAIGCPLKPGNGERPVVDWLKIRELFHLEHWPE